MRTLNDIITEKFKLDKNTKSKQPNLSANCKKELKNLLEQFDDTYNTYYDEAGDRDWGPDDYYIQLFEDFFDGILENENDPYVRGALQYIFENYKIKFPSGDNEE